MAQRCFSEVFCFPLSMPPAREDVRWVSCASRVVTAMVLGGPGAGRFLEDEHFTLRLWGSSVGLGVGGSEALGSCSGDSLFSGFLKSPGAGVGRRIYLSSQLSFLQSVLPLCMHVSCICVCSLMWVMGVSVCQCGLCVCLYHLSVPVLFTCLMVGLCLWVCVSMSGCLCISAWAWVSVCVSGVYF